MAVDVRSITRVRTRPVDRAAVSIAHVAWFVLVADLAAIALAVNVAGLHGPRVGAYLAAEVVVLGARGHYRIGITPSAFRDATSVLGGLAVPLVPFALVAGEMQHTMLLTGAIAMPAVLVGRVLSYAFVRQLRRRGTLIEPTLIIGAGQLGHEVAMVLQDHPEYGLLPVGFLDTFDDDDLPLPILGGPRALDVILREYEVRRVIIAFGGTREPEIVPIVRACDRASVDIHVLPRFFELGVAPEGADTDDIWGIPLIRLRRSALRRSSRTIKRSFDVLVAGVALLLVSPLLAAVAVAVRCSSPGPILFRQRRVGQNGRVVEILKFRTMRVNDDSDYTWSVDQDDRLTRVGALLRRTSLDELPQLINVVRGEMSLVGPRPERPFFVEQFDVEVPRYNDRHRVPVGMTGWAQVHGLRGDTSIAERARFDNQYIENWSLWRDIVVLFRTAREMLRGG